MSEFVTTPDGTRTAFAALAAALPQGRHRTLPGTALVLAVRATTVVGLPALSARPVRP